MRPEYRELFEKKKKEIKDLNIFPVEESLNFNDIYVFGTTFSNRVRLLVSGTNQRMFWQKFNFTKKAWDYISLEQVLELDDVDDTFKELILFNLGTFTRY